MDAARHWARGERRQAATIDDGVADDLRSLGVSSASIDRVRDDAPEPAEPFGVWPANWPVLELFLACQTQWRIVAVAGLVGGGVFYQGLDYTALKAAHEMRGGTWSAELFEDVQAMESAALPALNSR